MRILVLLFSVIIRCQWMVSALYINSSYTTELVNTSKVVETNHDQNVPKGIFEIRHKKQAENIFKGRRKRQALVDSHFIWPGAIVPFAIDENTTGEYFNKIRKAMRQWETYTCVQFVRASPTDKNQVYVSTEKQVCESDVGMQDGIQTVMVQQNHCSLGNIIHELMHLLGFYHEHMRPDRDKYIKVIKANIDPLYLDQFSIDHRNAITSMGLPYDIKSIMHYAAIAFPKSEGLKTIESKRHLDFDFGQRIGLSKGDKLKVNMLYRCPTCGSTLLKESGTITISKQSSENNYCVWRIIASSGNRVRFQLTSIDLPYSTNCTLYYVGFRDLDRIPTQYNKRFCGNVAPKRYIESFGNRLIIELRVANVEKFRYNGFKGKYNIICGTQFKQDKGWLDSPNYPEKYSANLNCNWTIEVSKSRKAAITFLDFHMIECHDDFVEIKDGKNEKIIKRLSNSNSNDSREPIVSASNLLLIHFVSNDSCGGFSSRFYSTRK